MVKAKIPAQPGYSPTLPPSIPDLDEVRSFSNHLHATSKHWQGVIFGWSAEYIPERRRKPVDSKMTLGLPARRVLDWRERHLVFLTDVGARKRQRTG